MSGLVPGLVGTATLTVTASDTATAVGSGDVDVLATPRLVALCEAATLVAIGNAVPAGKTTVGVRVELDHLRPSHPGAVVNALAELEAVEGRKLVFSVAATQESETVGRGTVIRAVVDRSTFET